MINEFRVDDVLVGYTDPGRHATKLFVSAEVSIHADHDYTTVEHEVVRRAIRVTLSGVEVRWNGSITRDGDWYSCGQNLDMLQRITRPVKPFTLDDLTAIHEVWRDFHLSDMQAACDHMTLPEDKRYEAREHIACEAGSGYRYGRSWLVLPEDRLVAPIARLRAALRLGG